MKHTVTEHQLANGAKGLVVHVPEAQVVNIVVRFNSGFQFSDRSRYEVPHLMEHLIGCGSKKYPGPNQFKIEVEKNGAYRNAYTSDEVNGYVFECAAFELERILDLSEEYLARPLFPEEAFSTELSNVREELSRFTTQHAAVCSMALAERAFPEEQLNYETRIEQLPTFNRQHVVDHYESTHTSANARFYVSGHLPSGGQKVVDRLERVLDLLPRGERLRPLQKPGRGQAAPIVTQRDIKQIYYSFRMYAEELPWELRNASLLLRMLLTGGFQSRIYGEARRRGLAYHVDASRYAGPGASSFGFEGYVTADNIQPLFQLMADQYREVAAGKFTSEELEAAKDLMIGSTTRSFQTAGDMLGWYLAPYDREDRILDYDSYLQELREVTPELVRTAAQRFVGAGERGISLLGDVDEAKVGQYAAALEQIAS